MLKDIFIGVGWTLAGCEFHCMAPEKLKTETKKITYVDAF